MRTVYVTETPIGAWTQADQSSADAAGAQIVAHVDGGYPPWLAAAGVNAPGVYQVADPTDPPQDLEGARSRQLAALTERKTAALAAMSYQGYAITLTPQDQIDILGAVQQLTASAAGTTLQWEVVDGVFVTWALADVQALYAAGMAHVQACYANASALAAAINAAATAADVYAVDLTSGWPA